MSCQNHELHLLLVKALNNLKHLDISHSKVTDKAADELATALTINPLLEHLYLSNCDLSELHTAGIVKALSKTAITQ